jgi:hypothetical protein
VALRGRQHTVGDGEVGVAFAGEDLHVHARERVRGFMGVLVLTLPGQKGSPEVMP